MLLLCTGFASLTGKASALPLAATYTVSDVSACGNGADGSIKVIPAGGTAPYTFSWTGLTGVGALIPFTAGNVGRINSLLIGFYNVVITDAASNSMTITGIHVADAFYVYITNSGTSPSSCNNSGSILLYGNAGVRPYAYSLNGVQYQTSNLFTNLGPANYTAYIKDAAGCISTKPITLIATPPVFLTGNARAASSCTIDGSIVLYVTGGKAPYRYSLDDNNYQASNTFSGLRGNTTYTGWVKDMDGCKASVGSLTVGQAPALTLTISRTNSSSCIANGSLQLTASGGIPPYTYSLDNIIYQTANTFTGLPAGNYQAWAKDSRGCKVTSSTKIIPKPIIVTAAVTDATSCNSADGTIALSLTGGTNPFTYSLDGNQYQSSNIFTGLGPGTYTGFVKDGMACIGTIQIVVGPYCGRIQPVAINISPFQTTQ